MDFVELDKSTAGNCYALVFQDYLTKWPEVYVVNNRRAETVAKCSFGIMVSPDELFTIELLSS